MSYGIFRPGPWKYGRPRVLPLFVGTKLTYSVKSNKPAYLKGQIITDISTPGHTVPGYLKGQDTTKDNKPFYLYGEIVVTSSILGYLRGQDTANGSVPGYLSGQSTTSSSKPACIASGIPISSSQSGYISGTGTMMVPVSDVSTNNWKNEANGSDLYPSLADSDDGTYAWFQNVIAGSSFEVLLTTIDDPGDGTHQLHWQAYRKEGAFTMTVKCELFEGTSLIVSDTQTINDAVIDYTKDLTPTQVLSITDYTDLRIRITVTEVTL